MFLDILSIFLDVCPNYVIALNNLGSSLSLVLISLSGNEICTALDAHFVLSEPMTSNKCFSNLVSSLKGFFNYMESVLYGINLTRLDASSIKRCIFVWIQREVLQTVLRITRVY